MFKKLLLVTLTAGALSNSSNAATWSFPQKTDQSVIINTIYSVGASEKLTVLVVVNENYIKGKEKDGLTWMIDNVKNRLGDFWYCEHLWDDANCTCKSVGKTVHINYAQISSFEPLSDLCGKAGAPVLFILKNGLILNKITRDVLLSTKMYAHEKEQMIIDIINETYRKSLTRAE